MARRRPAKRAIDPAPDVIHLHAVWCEATGRDPTANVLDAVKVDRLAEMIAWAGSVEAAERGVRKVGGSAHHRGQNAHGKRYDRLTDKPFRTAESFVGWCELPAADLPASRATLFREDPLTLINRLNAEMEAKS